MKNIFTLILAVSFLQLSATQVKKVKSEIKKVTVFKDQAQIVSEVSTELQLGQTDIKIINLPGNIKESSISITGKGNFTIQTIQYNYSRLPQKSNEAILLEDSIAKVEYDMWMINNQHDVLKMEEKAIFENQKIGGHDSGLEVKELEKLADFIRDRINEIKKMELDLNRTGGAKSVLLNKLRNQLNELQGDSDKLTGEIIVKVLSKENTNAKLTVEYLVNNAGWNPVYDIRVKNTNEPALLIYKANVYQNTGLEWKNVNVSLSTANPSSNSTKPELSPWYLNFYEPPIPYQYRKSTVSKSDNSPTEAEQLSTETYLRAMTPEEEAEYISNYTNTIENQMAVTFQIGQPITVKSGNKAEMIEIKTHSLNADYSYTTVPKFDTDAFLIAYLRNWENLNLINGPAKIYFDDAYIGSTMINPKQTTDSLAIALGRDKKIVVERKLLKDFTSKKFIGFTKKEEFAYQITVRNTKQEPIDISVEDQLPISQNKEIEVEIQDKGGANYDINSGKLTWPIKLVKGETKTLTFKFSVKFPKGKVVDNL